MSFTSSQNPFCCAGAPKNSIIAIGSHGCIKLLQERPYFINGLEHIINGDGKTSGRSEHFEKAFGISKEQIPLFLNNVISHGKVVSNQLKSINGREGFERIYYYNGKHYALIGIGTNGFIVTAYPIEYGG